MQIAKTAAAIITILVAITVLQHSTGWAEGNNAPVMATPSSTSLKYLFPHGTAAERSFPSDPATDTDDDTITYRFVFTVPDTSTVGDTTDTTEVEPSDALFSVSQSENRSNSRERPARHRTSSTHCTAKPPPTRCPSRCTPASTATNEPGAQAQQ